MLTVIDGVLYMNGSPVNRVDGGPQVEPETDGLYPVSTPSSGIILTCDSEDTASLIAQVLTVLYENRWLI